MEGWGRKLTFYHGSPVDGLSELKPFLSEHGKPYIYFSIEPLVALLYAVRPVPKPFSFYPYGFDKDGCVVYSEYFENAFYELYHGKTGYLYQCENVESAENPTVINCAYVCTRSVKVERVTVIHDLYAFYQKQSAKDKFRVKPCSEISEKEMSYILGELKNDAEKHNLSSTPQHPMSLFLRAHFPALWAQIGLFNI